MIHNFSESGKGCGVYVLISRTDSSAGVRCTVEEPEALTSLDVRIVDVSAADAAASLASSGLGTIDDDHAWLRVDALRAAGTGVADPEWPEKFTGMIDYARRSGWLSADGQLVRAHLTNVTDR